MAKGDFGDPWIVQQSGGDFGSFEACTDGASVGPGDYVEIRGTWSSAEVGQVTTEDDGLIVECVGSSKHPGYRNAGSESHYRLYSNSAGFHTILCNHDITIIGMDMSIRTSNTSDEVFRIASAGNDVTLQDCLIYCTQRFAEQDLVHTSSSAVDNCTINLINCIGWDAHRAVVDVYQGSGIVVNINSCHFYNIGFSSAASTRSGIVGVDQNVAGDTVDVFCFNSLLHMADVSYFPFLGDTGFPALEVSVDRCVTNVASTAFISWFTEVLNTDNVFDATWVESGGSGTRVFVEDITTGVGDRDLRLVSDANNAAEDAHSDGSGAGLTMPSTDILGTTRAAVYEIGPFTIAVGGNTTLTAESGTFNLTGAAAALLHDRTLPAAAGSFSLTGSAAALVKGHHLAAGSGSFALTGAAAALLWDRVIAAASGSFILSGTDVTLTKTSTLSLTAESVAFNLTGAAAALLHDRTLPAAAGSFSLTGSAAALVKGHHLAAGSGSFALTGAAAALLINRRLNVETGAFVLTGTPVTLTYSPVGNTTLTAESGTFNLTGAAAALLHDRILAAQSASYALSGTDAVLARGSRLAAAAGGFTLTGTDVGLLLARVLNAESGAYVLTGTPVTLSYSGQLLIGIAPGIVSSSTGRNVVSSTSKRSIEST